MNPGRPGRPGRPYLTQFFNFYENQIKNNIIKISLISNYLKVGTH